MKHALTVCCVSLLSLLALPLYSGASPATKFLPTREEACAEIVAWGLGYASVAAARGSGEELEGILTGLTVAAEAEHLQVELLLAVLAAEGRLAPTISHARSAGWVAWATENGADGGEMPVALKDGPMGAQKLAEALAQRDQLEDSLVIYWAGPKGAENKATRREFVAEAQRVLAALEPYMLQRLRDPS